MTETSSSWTQMLQSLGNPEMARLGVPALLLLLGVSALVSIFVAWLYRRFYGGRSTGSEIHRAFPLLGVSITAIFLCIQFSLPLSLGLLGALSIVRFRTPIKEPEEIGFLMLVIATSLACATFNFTFLGVLLGIAIATLLIREVANPIFRPGASGGLLLVTLDEATYGECGRKLLETVRASAKGRLESLSRDGERIVLSYRFRRLDDDQIQGLEGEIQQLTGGAETSFVLSTPATF